MWAIKLVFILFSIVLALFLSVKRETQGKIPYSINFKGLFIGLVIITLAFILNDSIGQVPAGSRGIVTRFGKVTGRILGEGIYMVTPVAEKVHLMSVQVQAYEADAEAASRDLQDVHTKVTLNFAVDPVKTGMVYQTLGYEYSDRIIKPAVQEAVKSATAKYDAEELITKRPIVKDEIEKYLKSRLAQHGFLLYTISITDFRFSSDFTAAVERKVTAIQNAQTELNNMKKEEYIAQQKVISAKGEADALKLKREQLTSEMIRYEAVKRWDGKLPQYMGGNAPVPFIGIENK